VQRLEEAAADDRKAQANEFGRIKAEQSLGQEEDMQNVRRRSSKSGHYRVSIDT
jgi:hypothetical protein